MKFSIVIINHNYERFVASAIESALAVDWRDTEVIVVDDGSTDSSRDIIETYRDRVVTIFKANGGQNSAANLGFAKSTGDIVVFLDSDDMLRSQVAQMVVRAWREGVSKVQFTLDFISETGKPIGRRRPIYRSNCTPEKIKQLATTHGDYPCPTTSGNAWARSFLESVFPIPTREDGIEWFDMYLNLLAPYYGDVICIPDDKPQGFYRVHRRSLSRSEYALQQVNAVAATINAFLIRKGKLPIEFARSEIYTKCRLVQKRLGHSGHSGGPTMPMLLITYWRAVGGSGASLLTKIKWVAWSFLISVPLTKIALWAISVRDSWNYTARSGEDMTLYDAQFFRRQSGQSDRSAREVIPIIQQIISFQSVCDIGCGTGDWLRVIHESGTKDILGIDGPYVDKSKLRIPENLFVTANLRESLSVGRRFDLAMSLEVAEHLPVERAHSFVRDLTRLAPVVLFSAAIPGQGGVGHVNEQWQTYWEDLFRKHRYIVCDALRPAIWYKRQIAYWYRQNAVFYCHEDALESYPGLLAADHALRLPLVHPERLSVRDSIRSLRASIRVSAVQAARRHVVLSRLVDCVALLRRRHTDGC